MLFLLGIVLPNHSLWVGFEPKTHSCINAVIHKGIGWQLGTEIPAYKQTCTCTHEQRDWGTPGIQILLHTHTWMCTDIQMDCRSPGNRHFNTCTNEYLHMQKGIGGWEETCANPLGVGYSPWDTRHICINAPRQAQRDRVIPGDRHIHIQADMHTHVHKGIRAHYRTQTQLQTCKLTYIIGLGNIVGHRHNHTCKHAWVLRNKGIGHIRGHKLIIIHAQRDWSTSLNSHIHAQRNWATPGTKTQSQTCTYTCWNTEYKIQICLHTITWTNRCTK